MCSVCREEPEQRWDSPRASPKASAFLPEVSPVTNPPGSLPGRRGGTSLSVTRHLVVVSSWVRAHLSLPSSPEILRLNNEECYKRMSQVETDLQRMPTRSLLKFLNKDLVLNIFIRCDSVLASDMSQNV